MVEAHGRIHKLISSEARKIFLLSQILSMLFLSACEISNVQAVSMSEQSSSSAADFARDFDIKWHTIGKPVTVLKDCLVRMQTGARIYSAPDARNNESFLEYVIGDFDIYYPLVVRYEPAKQDFLAFTSRDIGKGKTIYSPRKSTAIKELPMTNEGCQMASATIVGLPSPVEYGTEGISIARYNARPRETVGVGRGTYVKKP